jgi:hypothetical protein
VKRIGQRSGCQTWRRGRLRLSFVTLRREEIDWAGLRAAAVAIGIRPAARQAAQDLPPDEQERFVQRAMRRCSREKWLVKSQQDKANAIAKSPTALSADVRKGSDVSMRHWQRTVERLGSVSQPPRRKALTCGRVRKK